MIAARPGWLPSSTSGSARCIYSAANPLPPYLRSNAVSTLPATEATGLRETVGADVYAYYLPDESLRDAAEQAAQAALGHNAYDEAVAAGRSLDPSAVPELA
jgi:hypothetical protein